MNNDLNRAFALQAAEKNAIIDKLKNKDKNTPEGSEKLFDRGVILNIVNMVPYSAMYLKDCDPDPEGVWMTYPPEKIVSYRIGTMQTVSLLLGTSGWAEYLFNDNSTCIKFIWDNPYIGNNTFTADTSNPRYILIRSGDIGGFYPNVTWIVGCR